MARPKISGVYLIQSISQPSRVYIGSAGNDIFDRWKIHKGDLRRGEHHSPQLQRHYDKYGLSDLSFEIIESGEYLDKNHLLAREQGWYIPYTYKNKEIPYFNNCLVAGSSMGMKWSEESKQRFRKPKTPEHRAKSMAILKRLHETPISEETRIKKRETALRLGQRPPAPQIGHVHSTETIEKIRKSMLGKNKKDKNKDNGKLWDDNY